MKFRVIINKAKEEEVVATVHQRTDLIDEIEAVILRDERTDALAAYLEDEIRLLDLAEVECITANEGRVYAAAWGGPAILAVAYTFLEIEQLPIAIATIIHMAVLYVDYLLAYSLNGWLPARGIVTFTVLFFVIFIVIWLIVYFCTVKPSVRKLNEKLNEEK